MTYPKDGLYYIKSSSNLDCYANIRYGENVLRGEHVIPMEYSQKWRLTEVHQSDTSGLSEFFCTLTKEKDNDTLGVKDVKDSEPVYSLDGPQAWSLDKADEGYNITMDGYDGRYSWHLRDKGEPIKISLRGIIPSQIWQFVSAE